MVSAGNGTGSHVSGELFNMMAGVDLLHVPYRGGAPALTDLIGGRVQVTFLPTTGIGLGDRVLSAIVMHR
jgi:tripartite-type tricarboxylate transporter receptor subunit TctC